MLLMLKVCLLLFFATILEQNNANKLSDNGKYFRKIYTTTVNQIKKATTMVPSSCVQVESTLPICKDVSFLRIPTILSPTDFVEERIIENWKTDSKIKTTPLSWGEYFGFHAPTVTVTITDLHVSTIEDPSIVVTYAIKGCRPFLLSFNNNMNKCPPDPQSSVSIQEILPTSTIVSPSKISTETVLPTQTMANIESTLSINAPNWKENLLNNTQSTEQPDNTNTVQSSIQEINVNSNSEPTEPL